LTFRPGFHEISRINKIYNIEKHLYLENLKESGEFYGAVVVTENFNNAAFNGRVSFTWKGTGCRPSTCETRFKDRLFPTRVELHYVKL
jgi:hypothetical protein